MISRDDLPDTPEWTVTPHCCCALSKCEICQPQLTIPPNVTLGAE